MAEQSRSHQFPTSAMAFPLKQATIAFDLDRAILGYFAHISRFGGLERTDLSSSTLSTCIIGKQPLHHLAPTTPSNPNCSYNEVDKPSSYLVNTSQISAKFMLHVFDYIFAGASSQMGDDTAGISANTKNPGKMFASQNAHSSNKHRSALQETLDKR